MPQSVTVQCRQVAERLKLLYQINNTIKKQRLPCKKTPRPKPSSQQDKMQLIRALTQKITIRSSKVSAQRLPSSQTVARNWIRPFNATHQNVSRKRANKSLLSIKRREVEVPTKKSSMQISGWW